MADEGEREKNRSVFTQKTVMHQEFLLQPACKIRQQLHKTERWFS